MTGKKLLWSVLLALPLAVAGGFVYANSLRTGGYVCQVTGERLPCEKCCPLNQDGFLCPATGDVLPCERCCPLNQQQ